VVTWRKSLVFSVVAIIATFVLLEVLLQILAYTFPKVNGLKYFHEPAPDRKLTYEFSWTGLVENGVNKDALKDRFNYSIKKASNVFRIITLGDSFTYGLHVSTADIWPEKLEDLLNSNLSCSKYKKFEVINLGEQAYDIQYEVERFKIRGIKYNPNLLVWMVLDNDFSYIEEELGPSLSNGAAELVRRGVTPASSNYGFSLYTYAINEFRKKWDEGETLDFQMHKLEEFDKYYNGSLVFYGLGNYSLDNSQYIDAITEFSGNRKTTYFYRSNNPSWDEYLLLDDHPNKKGHKLIARDIFDYLMKNKLIPCGAN